MLSEHEFYDRVQDLLRNRSSIDDFEGWLVSESWNMHILASPIAQRLASSVELRLAELGQGNLQEDEFRRELRELLAASEIGSSQLEVSFSGGAVIVLRVPRDSGKSISGTSYNPSPYGSVTLRGSSPQVLSLPQVSTVS